MRIDAKAFDLLRLALVYAMRLPALMIVAALVLTSIASEGRGQIMGGKGNCVRVVKASTGFGGRVHNGRGFASSLLRSRTGYRVLSIRSRKRGIVCSWNEIGGGPRPCRPRRQMLSGSLLKQPVWR